MTAVWTSVDAVKGGVGCSLLSAVLARVQAKKNPQKVAVLDGLSPDLSLLPAFLAIGHSPRSLDQLVPYRDRLSSSLVETFFARSPEGAVYIPLLQQVRPTDRDGDRLELLSRLSPWFSHILVDLSSFGPERSSRIAELCDRNIVVSSLDHASISAVKFWEKKGLARHSPLKDSFILYNTTQPTQTPPKELDRWADHLQYKGIVPYLGSDLALEWSPGKPLPVALERSLTPILDPLFGSLTVPAKKTAPSGLSRTTTSKPVPVALEEVHLLHQELLDELRRSGALKDKSGTALQRDVMETQARGILDRLIQNKDISDREKSQRLVAETLDLAFGLGPLEPLLRDETITEVMVNGPHQVYVERDGRLEKSHVRFMDDPQLLTCIERILAPIGRRIDESRPFVDGRLPDGSRINAVIRPLSLVGPTLTIRKFSKKKLDAEDLIRFGSLTRESADLLGACVKARKNIVVSGGTGSGKTTLLNVLSNFIPEGERIVTIEDSAELRLAQDHVVRMESRPSSLEGSGQVTIRDLVINALRMRPDRIVVGECRGGETLDMLQAMNTGHDGSLTTVHANSPRDALSRLETLCLFTGLDLPLKAIREQIARAIHLVVQQSRLPDGKRAVTHISQVQGMEGDVIVLQDIFLHRPIDGLVRAPFPPSFLGDLKGMGYQWPSDR